MLDVLVQSGAGGSLPAFALGFKDLGAGAVDTSSQGSAATPTFTRATTAWTKLSSGLWASVASGQARSFYEGLDTTVGAYQGFLAEGARTNLCLQARDLTTTWTLLNTTSAKDQVGIDGVTNSASSLTCTVNGGSCLQTITEAATDSVLSLFIKRITGTGTITIQQGASTSDITAQINSSTYTQVSLDATVLNPAIGIVMGSSGDVIAVDMVQFENGAFATTPIPTTTIAVPRNADLLTYPVTGISQTTGTIFATISPVLTTGVATKIFVCIDDGTANERLDIDIASNALVAYNVIDGGVAQASMTNGGATTLGVPTKVTAVYTVNDFALSAAGNAVSTDAAGTVPATTQIVVGSRAGSASPAFGCVGNVRIWKSRLSNGQLQAMTT
jgi:hypothetical protein